MSANDASDKSKQALTEKVKHQSSADAPKTTRWWKSIGKPKTEKPDPKLLNKKVSDFMDDLNRKNREALEELQEILRGEVKPTSKRWWQIWKS